MKRIISNLILVVALVCGLATHVDARGGGSGGAPLITPISYPVDVHVEGKSAPIFSVKPNVLRGVVEKFMKGHKGFRCGEWHYDSIEQHYISVCDDGKGYNKAMHIGLTLKMDGSIKALSRVSVNNSSYESNNIVEKLGFWDE